MREGPSAREARMACDARSTCLPERGPDRPGGASPRASDFVGVNLAGSRRAPSWDTTVRRREASLPPARSNPPHDAVEDPWWRTCPHPVKPRPCKARFDGMHLTVVHQRASALSVSAMPPARSWMPWRTRRTSRCQGTWPVFVAEEQVDGPLTSFPRTVQSRFQSITGSTPSAT
jgi:hypothetical protein